MRSRSRTGEGVFELTSVIRKDWERRVRRTGELASTRREVKNERVGETHQSHQPCALHKGQHPFEQGREIRRRSATRRKVEGKTEK